MKQTTNHTLIIIPARYGSTRLPGKPLFNIAGKTLLQHVSTVALQAAQQIPGVGVLVATDDARIMQHAKEINVPAVLTPVDCACGTDRALAAIEQLPTQPEYVINLQGDAPLTPVNVISALLHTLRDHQVVTPAKQLSWAELDDLRRSKHTSPFSGTSVVFDKNNRALWFSKQIIPALRTEERLRAQAHFSPIFQHLGIYGYTTEILKTFASLPMGHYEQLEGLEQLRLLENGYPITVVPVELENQLAWRGVDTLEDAKFVENIMLGN
jgi:3-deoxy-manno-octulosonate cytidylyltransferase (CMP-KDO synthetase)